MRPSFQAVGRSWTLATLLSVSSVARAQGPSTNVATPAPNRGELGASEDVALAPQTSESGLAAEPTIPAESTRKTWPNRPLLLTGAVLLGGSYAASAIVAATSSRSADDKLYYPVAGPWVDLNRRDCDVNACSHKTLDTVLLVGDGVVQGIGALGMLLSFVIPEKTTRQWYLIGKHEVTVLPYASGSAAGIGAVGRF